MEGVNLHRRRDGPSGNREVLIQSGNPGNPKCLPERPEKISTHREDWRQCWGAMARVPSRDSLSVSFRAGPVHSALLHLCDRETDFEASGTIRKGGDRRGCRAGVRQQRDIEFVFYSSFNPGCSRESYHRDDLRSPDDAWDSAGPLLLAGASTSLLGCHGIDVRWECHAPWPEPAADWSLGQVTGRSLIASGGLDRHFLRHRCLQHE